MILNFGKILNIQKPIISKNQIFSLSSANNIYLFNPRHTSAGPSAGAGAGGWAVGRRAAAQCAINLIILMWVVLMLDRLSSYIQPRHLMGSAAREKGLSI